VQKTDTKWTLFFALLLLLALPLRSPEGAAIDLDGYLKDFHVIFAPPDYADSLGLDDDFYNINIHRIRLDGSLTIPDESMLPFELKFFLSYSLSANIQNERLRTFLSDRAESPEYRITDPRSRIYPEPGSQAGSFGLRQNIDRCYIAVSGPFDLYLGRQPFGWGAGRTVNPTDVLAPFRFDELDREERVGLDAVRLIYPLGVMSEIDAGLILGKDAESSESAGYIRGRTYIKRTDISATVMNYRENLLVGMDMTRNIVNSVGWLEAAYNEVEGHNGKEDFLRLVAGWDRSFFRARLYSYIEYHYNGAGAGERDNYLSNFVNNPAYRESGIFLLGRHYILPSVNWQFTPLLTGTGRFFINLADGSVLFSPGIEFNASENFYIGGSGYIGLGRKSSGSLTSGSEFGDYGSILYLNMRYYF